MKQIILAGVIGAVVYYAWGMAAWMALPIHHDTMHNLPQEDSVKKALVEQNLEPGYYVVPTWPKDNDQEKMNAFKEAHRQGPIVSIIYAHGGEPMPPAMMAKGMVIDLVAAFVAALLLSGATCCRYYLQRVGFVLGLGLFASVVSYGALWNWMYFPLDYTLGMVVDVILGWTLVGMVMGFIIKPQHHQTNETTTSTDSGKEQSLPMMAIK